MFAALSALQAIKITIPEQYEEQVEAIKRAEQTKVERQIDAAGGGGEEAAGQQDGMRFSSGDGPEEKPDAGTGPDRKSVV